jgi:hypothetical protein
MVSGTGSICLDTLECIEEKFTQAEFAVEERLFLAGSPTDKMTRALVDCTTG